MDNNLHEVGIFLDLTTAYDVINHDILLYKLESYDVRGILNSWLESNLSQHTHYVSLTQTNGNNVILNRYSSLFRVNLHGVPQGLILGTLLFRLHINDLPQIFQGVNFVLYADDIITENLAWHVQIHSLCTSLSTIYYLIKSVKNVTSTQTIWNIYFAYFQSRLWYGIMF